jgi:hypothetical protein
MWFTSALCARLNSQMASTASGTAPEGIAVSHADLSIRIGRQWQSEMDVHTIRDEVWERRI